LRLERDDLDVLVHGEIRATVPQVCGRCLERFGASVAAAVDVRVVPRPATADNVELAADDLDVEFYAKDELDLGVLIETETTRAQAPHPLQARGAAARPLPAVPRGQAAAPGLPPLRLLQGPGDRRRRRGLAPARWASPYFVLGRRRCSRTTAYAPLGSSLEPRLARSSSRRLSHGR